MPPRRQAKSGTFDKKKSRDQSFYSAEEKEKFKSRLSIWERFKLEVQEKKEQAIELANSDEPHDHEWSRRIIKHPRFEPTMGIVIVLNCFFIGWQASDTSGDIGVEIVFMLFENIFTMIFVAELVIRLFCYGPYFLLSPFNFGDAMLIIITGVFVNWILLPAGADVEALRQFQVLRTLRLVRLARAVRLLPQFKEMWMLVRGLTDSLTVLLWTYVMIFFILYIFALAATSLIGGSMEDDEFAQEMFGTVPLSMFTLFQIMTLDSWTGVVRPIGEKQSWTYIFFLGFIAISVFVLVNLITAVIVENAFESSKADEQDMAVVMQREKEKEVEELKDLFLECDQDGSGELTKPEFLEAIAKPKIKQKLTVLEIQTSEINELWDILDDGDGQLSAEEFTVGIRKLKGESKAKDVMGVLHEVKKMEDGVKRLEEAAYDVSENLIDARIGVSRLHEDLSAMFRVLKKVNTALAAAAAVQGQKETSRPGTVDSY
eukprot:gnl/MRDRNA2_/MRDRNA2_117111_c0_seq1.p1 gnl/MRDRNA2_/MRDRNA2_117111_c0~~gnl/MRDRNA2_/MRDRNA2_117111_c0_seq1.p1  ORF type:complete len:487 (-),score=116.06 gnl/MRDRNA2_/MRDRNA2_117111_c0_seq1:12-1472(-)